MCSVFILIVVYAECLISVVYVNVTGLIVVAPLLSLLPATTAQHAVQPAYIVLYATTLVNFFIRLTFYFLLI
jgi:hypothetical protein